MILATGSSQICGRRNGFTLIEIILVIALITLGAGAVIVNFNAFADRGNNTSPEETLREAIRQARFKAAADRIITRLSYDEESGSLRVEPGSESFTINADFGPEGRGEIRFFLIPPAEGLSPFPNPYSSRLETKEVAFAPDRSSSPFIAEIDSGLGSPTRLYFDPFSDIVRTEE